VHLRDTDATGVLYFSEQFRMALEAFESFLRAKGDPLHELLQSPLIFPIVHAEADYLAPLKVGDPLEITLHEGKVGTTSLTLHYRFFDPQRKQEVGRVKIVHVATDKKSQKAVAVPERLRVLFPLV
jgi:1,4-dihydroxy-2-naphthoyl-CoA hydrolase